MSYAKRSFIYGLVDPRTQQVRYIGKTVNGMLRPSEHGFPCKLRVDKTYKANWIRQLKELSLEYLIQILEEAPKEKLASLEQKWIAHGKAQGWPLTNLTDGGEGLHGHVFSEEHKAKISAANTGRKLTPEQKEKQRLGCINRPMSTRDMTKLRESRLGSHHTEETKQKIREGNRGKKCGDETRQKIREAHEFPIREVTSGVWYPSMTVAARDLGINKRTIWRQMSGTGLNSQGLRFERVQRMVLLSTSASMLSSPAR